MIDFTPVELARWTGGTWSREPSIPVRGFAMDTRQLSAGQAFVALKTERRDGHEFLPAAIAGGASAAIVSRLDPALALSQLVVGDPLCAWHAIAREHRYRFQGPVIGVTGSCGKTSTKELLALLLGGSEGGVHATEGNLNNHLGVPLTLTLLDRETHRAAVIEAGISAPGEMQRLASMIRPDVALTTLVAPAHLEELGGLEGVAREKARLSEAVSPEGVCVFPAQCLDFEAYRSLGGNRLVAVPMEAVDRRLPEGAERVSFRQEENEGGTRITLGYRGGAPLRFQVRRLSRGMVQNAVLAIGAALWLGRTESEIRSRLALWRPVRMRGEVRQEGGRLIYIDCYNANPASMADALEAFAAVAPEEAPRLYVIGGMEELGPEAARYHRELGSALRLRPQDQARLVGSHAPEMRAGLLTAGAATAQVAVAADGALLAPEVQAWKGSVFVKGSRRYALERALGGGTEAPAH